MGGLPQHSRGQAARGGRSVRSAADACRVNRKLGVGDTLNEVFALYGAHAGVLLPIAFWIYLVTAVLSGVAASGGIGLQLGSLVVSLLAGVLYQGIVVILVREVQGGRTDLSMRELVDEAIPFVGPLLGAGLLAALGTALGLVALIVPGLFLMTIWAVIAPVIVVEKVAAMESFGRSRELVRGNGWPVLGTVLVGLLIFIVVGAVLSSIAFAITDGVILQIVFSALAATVTAPITALVAAVLYYRLLPPAPAAEPVYETAPPPSGT